MAKQPDCPMDDAGGVAADGSLAAQGWTRRFLADSERAAEAVGLYRSMGLEVRAEKPSETDFGQGCTACAETSCRSYLMIYTRPKENRR